MKYPDGYYLKNTGDVLYYIKGIYIYGRFARRKSDYYTRITALNDGETKYSFSPVTLKWMKLRDIPEFFKEGQ